MKLLIILISLTFVSCDFFDKSPSLEILYFKDNRTGICFAKSSQNTLAYVPCDKIPPHMLKITNE